MGEGEGDGGGGQLPLNNIRRKNINVYMVMFC